MPHLLSPLTTNAALRRHRNLDPSQHWRPQLKGEGLTVRQIKVEKGCYEVYAIDKGGNKVNVAYNAETLQKLTNAEAGEN